MSIPTYRFLIDDHVYDVGTAGPGLGWQTVLEEAVRRLYVERGAVQGRWVKVLTSSPVKKYHDPRWERRLVVTSRYDRFVVWVREWTELDGMEGAGAGREEAVAQEARGGTAARRHAGEPARSAC